jgi:hypothetical protein
LDELAGALYLCLRGVIRLLDNFFSDYLLVLAGDAMKEEAKSSASKLVI